MAYDNSRRTAAAAQARHRVLLAARDCFLAQGFAATTIAAVARQAGVSPESVYKQFGGKAGLLKAVYDVAIAGDEEPVPVAQREEAQAVRTASDPSAAARAYARMATVLGRRTSPVLAVLLAARATDDQLVDLAATLDAERLAGATAVVTHWEARGWLRHGLTVASAADLVWTLISPEVRDLLTRRGWGEAAYTDWLGRAIADAVLAPA